MDKTAKNSHLPDSNKQLEPGKILYNIPFKDLSGFVYSNREKKILSGIVSQKYAEKKLILPISLKGSNLTLALFKPEYMHVVHELKRMYSYLNISCILITEEKFEELFEILYSKYLGGATSTDKHKIDTYEEDIDFIELNLDEEIKGKSGEAPVCGIRDIETEEMVNFILKYGIINDASDIHIEQDRKGPRLRYRLDGVLREVNIKWLEERLQEKVGAIISRIKVMSNLDVVEKRLPQDGVFRINHYDKAQGKKFDVDFRVATCRGIVEENVTIRILDSRKADISLENLNHSPHVLEPLKTLLKSSAGMILVAGPTGTGKTSTLYGILRYIYKPDIKIITAEDPIEYSFPGIMQTQTNPKINLTFSKLLRSFLRLDPDVILVGEMRDEETAKIGFDAAQTGHLLLSAIHSNDAVSAVSQLLDLNVEHSRIASCLTGIITQRLVRKNCPSCIKKYVPAKSEWSMLFKRYPSHLRFYKGQGCEVCNFTGYKGRTILSEIFVIDNEIAQALNRGLDEDGLKKPAIERGMKTMLEDGLLKLKETTLSEIIRVMPHDMIKEFQARGRAEEAADVSPGAFHISSPETQRELIDLMKEKYETLKAKTGHASGTVTASLFKEFITTSFYQICKKYNCKNVTFNIENKEGKTEISAIPGS